jgi:hypothetical protein
MKLGGFSQHRELELMCSAGFSASWFEGEPLAEIRLLGVRFSMRPSHNVSGRLYSCSHVFGYQLGLKAADRVRYL